MKSSFSLFTKEEEYIHLGLSFGKSILIFFLNIYYINTFQALFQ